MEPACLGLSARGHFSSRGALRRRQDRLLLAVFLYSGLYHECFSFMANSGYGGPALYFALQYVGVAIENTRRMRGLLRGRIWLARTWTFAVVVSPLGLFLHASLVNEFLVPMLVAGGVPGLAR